MIFSEQPRLPERKKTGSLSEVEGPIDRRFDKLTDTKQPRIPERSRRGLSLDHLSRIAPAILGAKVTRPSAPKKTTAFAHRHLPGKNYLIIFNVIFYPIFFYYGLFHELVFKLAKDGIVECMLVQLK